MIKKISKTVCPVLLAGLMQTSEICPIQEQAIPVAIGYPELIELPAQWRYTGSSLIKNLCAGLSQTHGYELASCGVESKTVSYTYFVNSRIRFQNRQLQFETTIRDAENGILAITESECEANEYSGLIIESHTRVVLERLSAILKERKIEATRALSSSRASTSGVHRHDGFYFNSVLGAGWSGISDFGMGGAGLFGIKLGAAFRDHFVIFGGLDTYWLYRPIVEGEIRFGKAASLQISGNLDGYIFMPALTAGAGYYTDNNYFLLFSIGVTAWQTKLSESVKTFGASTESNPGIDLCLSLGKEWWISADWGVGVAFILKGAKDIVRAGSLGEHYYFAGFAATATYN